jgi:hypothetical protein
LSFPKSLSSAAVFVPCWQWFLSWGETTASKRTIVSCSRRPDSRTNTLHFQPVKQVWQVFVVVRMGKCLPLLVKCESVVTWKTTSRSKYKYTTKYYNGFTKYWIKCEKLYKMTWKPPSVQQNNYTLQQK